MKDQVILASLILGLLVCGRALAKTVARLPRAAQVAIAGAAALGLYLLLPAGSWARWSYTLVVILILPIAAVVVLTAYRQGRLPDWLYGPIGSDSHEPPDGQT